MRNKFISEHIKKTTGEFRTPRQISSRIQQLRDTCPAQSSMTFGLYLIRLGWWRLVVDLITPFKHEATPTSYPQPPNRMAPGRPGNPYPPPPKPRASTHSHQVHNSPSEYKEGPPLSAEIAEPVPLRPSVSPLILTAPLSYSLTGSNSSQLYGLESMTPQSPMRDGDSTSLQRATEQCSAMQLQCRSPIRCGLAPFYIVDVFLNNTTSCVPLVPLAAMNGMEPLEISLAFQKMLLADGSFSLDIVVQLVSPCPLLARTVLSVFISGCQTSIYTEATTLLCNSVPICGTDWFYTVSLLPNFWNTLSSGAGQSVAHCLVQSLIFIFLDPRDYIIRQTIVPLCTEALAKLNHSAGTCDKPSIIYYRFCSIGPLFTLLHLGAQSYALHNPVRC